MLADTFKVEAVDDSAKKTRKSASVKRSNIFIVVAVVFLVIGILGICIVCGMYYATTLSELEYGVVFDAGSSHTSMYLYKWDGKKADGTGKVKEVSSCDVDGGGISSYVATPSKAGDSIVKCMNEAAAAIPWGLKKYSAIYVGATAGMRIVNFEDPQAAVKIFESVRDKVLKSGFMVQDSKLQIKILSGFEEGIGLWVTANYVAGTLGVTMSLGWSLLPTGHSVTLGVLDLGGASTQLAFQLAENATVPRNASGKLTLFNQGLSVFSESFLCFGALEMRRQVLAILAQKAGYQGNISHPCYAEGYVKNTTYDEVFRSICTKDYRPTNRTTAVMTVIGTANNAQCNKVMFDLFNMSSFAGGTLNPGMPDRFLARGAFAYTVNDLHIKNDENRINHTSFLLAMNKFCGKSYESISASGFFDASIICINAHYIDYLLTDVYQFSEEQWAGIIFSNKLNDVAMGWTLGYMTNKTTALPRSPKLDLYRISMPVFAVVIAITVVLIVLGIIAIVFACRLRNDQYHNLSQSRTSQPL